MTFQWARKKSGADISRKSPEEQIKWFEGEIARHEDLLYGIALFYEGISLMYAGHERVLETYRRQFRNIIQNGKNVLQSAAATLEKARGDRGSAKTLHQFAFSFSDGTSEQENMLKRADILARTYNRLLPGRDRSQALTQDETFRLIEEASEEFSKLAGERTQVSA